MTTAKKRPKSKSLPPCPMCGREPDLIESARDTYSAFFISCNSETPGTGGYYHHIEVIETTEAKALALWRKLASRSAK